MTFYSDLASTAKELLEEFGCQVTLTYAESQAYDPESGSSTKQGYAYTGTGVKLDYESKDIDGTNILSSDQRVLIAVDIPVVPKAGNILLIGSKEWTVINSKPLDPGGEAVLYDVQVRA